MAANGSGNRAALPVQGLALAYAFPIQGSRSNFLQNSSRGEKKKERKEKVDAISFVNSFTIIFLHYSLPTMQGRDVFLSLCNAQGMGESLEESVKA